jgi:hypothetical protein
MRAIDFAAGFAYPRGEQAAFHLAALFYLRTF